MFSQYSKYLQDFRMASCNAVLKSESKSELRQVSNSTQAQHFSSLELLMDSYMPEMALSSKSQLGPHVHKAWDIICYDMVHEPIEMVLIGEFSSFKRGS